MSIMVLLSGALVVIGPSSEISAMKSDHPRLSYVAHAPIRINSNADFNPAHGVTGGNGTVWNPWVIENYDINGAGYGYCISIGNTTQYFIVRGCYLHEASGGLPWRYTESALNMYNVHNGKAANNTVRYNTYYGINMESSNYINIRDNIVTSNGWEGIQLTYSDNNTIRGNDFSSNRMGASLILSDYNTMIANIANSSAQSGVYLDEAKNNSIDGNIVSYNGEDGITLSSSDGNSITNNLVAQNSYDGISTQSSNDNTISGNNATTNIWGGFYIFYSFGNTLADNAVSWNTYQGIYLDSSDGNNIANNTVSYNAYEGMYLDYSDGNIYTGNMVSNNGVGFSLEYSSDSNEIYHNDIIANTIQAYDNDINNWNGIYPVGGNFWSDYIGLDVMTGPSQNFSGTDGIGDTPYINIIGGGGAQDDYPLMAPVNLPTAGRVRNIDTTENFTTIQAAIDDPDTLSGHTIVAGNGTYRENLLVNKPIHLFGSGGTVLDGCGNDVGIYVLANNTEISGFTVTNCTHNSTSAAIRIRASHCTFRNNTIVSSSRGIDMGLPSTTALETVDTTLDYDAGQKSSSQDTFSVETSSDNPTVPEGEIRLANRYGDAFSKPDDGLNWKWENGNDKYYGNGVQSTQTKNVDMSRADAGYMALETVAQNDDLGIMAPSQIDCSYNWSLQYNFTRLYTASNNQWLMGILLIKDWNGTGVFSWNDYVRLLYYGFSTEVRYYSEVRAGSVSQGSQYVTTSHMAGALRVDYNAYTSTFGFYYLSGSTWTLLWTKVYNVNSWNLKLLITLVSYSTGLPDARFAVDNYQFHGTFAQAPWMPSGNWTSPVKAMPAGRSLTSTILECSNLTASGYIDRMEWLVGGTVVAACDNNFVSGTNITIRDSDLTAGTFASVNAPYQVRIFMAGDGWHSPIVRKISLASENTASNAHDNVIIDNTIRDNGVGAFVAAGYTNLAYHNNIINNAVQAVDSGSNIWDDGYPSGGNYWSDYTGLDNMNGPAQNVPGSDRAGDTPYIMDADSLDHYPLMAPWPNPVWTSGRVHNLNTGENFTTIQAALDDPDTLAGHTISAESGVYTENVVVDKALTLAGAGANSSSIDGRNLGNGVTVTANGASVSGFRITNSTSGPGPSGIQILASNVGIHDNTLTGNAKGIAIGVPTASSSSVIDTTADFDAGTKSDSLENYEIETRMDNLAILDGTMSLGNRFGDCFTYPSADATTWKWEQRNPDGMINATVRTSVITAGSLHLYALNTGVRGGTTVNIPTQLTGNFDIRVRASGTSAAAINQNENIYMKAYQNSANYAILSLGYDTANYIQSQTMINGVNSAVTTRDGTDVDRLFRIVRNATTIGIYYKMDGAADITSDTGWTLALQNSVGTATGPMWASMQVYTSASINSVIDGYFDNMYVRQGTMASAFRTSGAWTSALQSMPVSNTLGSTTIYYAGATAQKYIDRVEWLVNGTVKATYNTDVTSGSSIVIRQSDLASGAFSSVNGPYKVKVYLVGDASGSAIIDRILLNTSQYQYYTGNSIYHNNIATNSIGMEISALGLSTVHHNNFVNNTDQAIDDLGANIWNDTYPSGGNYWSDYSGPDLFAGPLQNLPGADFIGDAPYVIDSNSRDNYPLMGPWTSGPPDTTPPAHSRESPPIDGRSGNLTPVISVRVTDPSGVSIPTIRLYVNGFPVYYDLVPVASGYNVTYWHEGGFGNNAFVTCRIVAEDALGNLLDFSWHFATSSFFWIPVRLGWNLISVPLQPGTATLPSFLTDVDGDTMWDRAMWYNASNPVNRWKQYNRNWPSAMNDLKTVGNGIGFWINVTSAGDGLIQVCGLAPTPTSITLRAGWNMVGYPTLNATTILADAFWGTSADTVEVFDPGMPYLTKVASPTYVMKPGEGYWVHVPADIVWTVNW